jgi:hypothetical protein
MTLNTDTNFSVTGIFAPAPGAQVCFSNMVVGSALANSYGTSMASGDVMETFASDASGNVVAFILSNTDANGATLPNGGFYVTYLGLAGSCAGISGTDVPFRKISHTPPHPIPWSPRHGVIRPAQLHNPRIDDRIALHRPAPPTDLQRRID